jgi:hypothetical protein
MERNPIRSIGILASALATAATVACGSATVSPASTPTTAASPTSSPQPTDTAQSTATAQTLAAIVVEQPKAGDTVTSPLTVSGTADTFEATFVLELRDANDHVLCSQQVHATSGTGIRGTFTATVSFTARGAAKLVAYERSPRDGSAVNTVTVAVILT